MKDATINVYDWLGIEVCGLLFHGALSLLFV